MARLTVSDSSCKIDNAIIFPDAYEMYLDKVFVGNTVLIRVDRDRKTDAMVLKDINQL